MSVRAVEAWTTEPLKRFIDEARARIVMLMTRSGQVLAQYGVHRAVDVMSASALAAGISASTAQIAELTRQGRFGSLSHQGREHGIFLSSCETPRGAILVLVVFGRETSLGLVELFYEQLVKDLQGAAPVEPVRGPVLAEDFERELNRSLVDLFRKSPCR